MGHNYVASRIAEDDSHARGDFYVVNAKESRGYIYNSHNGNVTRIATGAKMSPSGVRWKSCFKAVERLLDEEGHLVERYIKAIREVAPGARKIQLLEGSPHKTSYGRTSFTFAVSHINGTAVLMIDDQMIKSSTHNQLKHEAFYDLSQSNIVRFMPPIEGSKYRLVVGETKPYIYCIYEGSIPLKRFIWKDEALDHLRKLMISEGLK